MNLFRLFSPIKSRRTFESVVDELIGRLDDGSIVLPNAFPSDSR
jgi:hypothetical protein